MTGPILHDDRVLGVSARSTAGDGDSFEVRATVTVAADGRHSGLVRQTGTTRARSRFRPRLFGMKRHLDVPDSAAEPVGVGRAPPGSRGVRRDLPDRSGPDEPVRLAPRVGPPPASRPA